MQKVFAIIVAAGKGLRMNDSQKKQYLCVAGVPVIEHTLRVFNSCDAIDKIFLVVPKEDLDFCRDKIISVAGSIKEIILVAGGPRRQDSVYNGLQAVPADDNIVVIHDGVRPLVTPEQLKACINAAHKHGACILGLPAFDTLKRVNTADTIIETLDRDTIWLAQTPQAFQYDLIVKAHKNARQHGLKATDDASLVEQLGLEVKIIEGSRRNIKITNPDDLKLARILLKNIEPQMG
jgi:2-C-methyl-D-erythritol 4-phosphate cytidylyltransferase